MGEIWRDRRIRCFRAWTVLKRGKADVLKVNHLWNADSRFLLNIGPFILNHDDLPIDVLVLYLLTSTD